MFLRYSYKARKGQRLQARVEMGERVLIAVRILRFFDSGTFDFVLFVWRNTLCDSGPDAKLISDVCDVKVGSGRGK